jgi:hypothetical protein
MILRSHGTTHRPNVPAARSRSLAGCSSVPALLSVLLFAAAAAAQTVEGTVTDAITGNGIPGARVTVGQAGKPDNFANTDARGRFHIQDLPDGAYFVSYWAPNYFPGDDAEAFRPFQLTAGIPVTLKMRLMPFARVSGRVVDARGEGVSRALVLLSGPGNLWARPADAQGKFEFHDSLPSGIYRLLVLPQLGLKPPDPDPERGQIRGWAPTYYPGVTTLEAATNIVVPPGGEVADLEFKLQAVPAHPVRGVLLKPDGKPVPKVQILVSQENTPIFTTQSAQDGSFEFNLVDGEWHIAAAIGSDDGRMLATQWIEMTGHEIEGLKLRLAPAFTVRGKAIAETPQGAPRPKFPTIVLASHLSRLRRASFPESSAAPHAAAVSRGLPDANGDFHADNVYPGLYRIFPMDPPPGYYLDSIRFGETELSTPEVEISSGSVPITVVYKTSGGVVRGTAENCASGGVILVPFNAAVRRPGFFPNGTCDANDRYQIPAVRPGDYYALAFPGNSPTPWYAAGFDDTLLSQSARVTVRAGEATSADLRAVSRAY